MVFFRDIISLFPYLTMILKIKRLHKDAILPSYAHPGDAGMDLYCVEAFGIIPGERKSVPTGIALEIPKGHAGLLWEKSGLSHKYGIKMLGGLIDSSYRGEICVGLINVSDKTFHSEKGHKIIQLIIQKVEHMKTKEVKNLPDSL